MSANRHFNIIGGGLAGALLAILLAQRGFRIDLYERRSDPRRHDLDGGRSINLALAARGIAALHAAGALEKVRPLMLPMRGRMLHEPGEPSQLLPYGSRENEVIWSVSRAALNLALIKEAAKHRGVSLHFDVSAVAVDTVADTLTLRASTGRERKIALTPSIAADGGGSAVRLSLANAGLLVAREALLDHDYKELTIPAVQGMPALDPAALHIWPRGGFMLIALPNPDHSFTATLFLARHGDPGFNSLDDANSVRRFFDRYLPDTRSLMPSQVSEFLDHPQGLLGTIRCDRWHVGGQVLLLGDAAHAIVPFHGQGANCAFEDCLELAALLDPASGHSDASVEEVFALFQQRRQANANAIAEMALENYTEMRDTVRDERFQRLKLLSLDLERRHPLRFIPRYSMVMFHAEIPYSDAQRRGAIQAAILDELDRRAGGSAVDFALADRLIEQQLSPLA